MPIDHYLWTNLNNTPVYIPLEDTIKLGSNTYVYPHMPEYKLEDTNMALTTMTQTLLNIGEYTFLTCNQNRTLTKCTK